MKQLLNDPQHKPWRDKVSEPIFTFDKLQESDLQKVIKRLE